MTTYTVTVACSFSHYGTIDIEAESDEAAIARAKAMTPFEIADAVTGDTQDDCGAHHRIVDLESDSETLLEDHYVFGDAFERDRERLNDAAPELLAALKAIVSADSSLSRGLMIYLAADTIARAEG